MTKTATITPTRCQSCGRTLTAQRSIARGRGPVCSAKVRRAAAHVAELATYKPFQITKAAELIAELSIVPTSRPALYLAVSSDGQSTYLVDAVEHSCTCPARADCYHLAAGDILTAA